MHFLTNQEREGSSTGDFVFDGGLACRSWMAASARAFARIAAFLSESREAC